MSDWVGKLGEHILAEVVVKGYVNRKSWDTTLFILEDKYGNILTINAPCNLQVGQKWKIDGIVKRQNLFNGQQQTHLQRWGLMLP
jgi:hypothetical protein